MTNALQVVAQDAERIVDGLVPSVNKLPQVVGVLIKQVEQLAGGELKNLADEALGIQPEPSEPATNAEISQLQQQLAEQAAVIKQLQANAVAQQTGGSGGA